MKLTKKSAITIAMLTITLLSLLPLPSTTATATTPWSQTYNPWSYRVPITIYNPNNKTLTDYQVKITINSSWTGWQYATNNSIRFALANGTPIPYWIQSWNRTAKTAVIWVKVPQLPANANTTIYMYFNNPNARSESNATKVFIFFDDFEEHTKLSGSISGSQTYYITNAIHGKYAIAWKDTSSTEGIHGRYNTTINATLGQYGLVASAWVYIGLKAVYCNKEKLQFGGVLAGHENPGASNEPEIVIGSVTDHLSSDIPYNAWYHYVFIWRTNGTLTINIYNRNGALEESASYTNTSLKFRGNIGMQIFTGAAQEGTIAFDLLTVREYAPHPVSVSVSDNLQEHAFPVTIILKNEQGQPINATAIIDSQIYNVSNGTTIWLSWGLHNITILNPPKYETFSLKNINITNATTLHVTLQIAKYNITFYAFWNSTPIPSYHVYITYANNTTTLLGVFSNGESVSLPYGAYLLTFNESPYIPVSQFVNLTHNTNVTFETQIANISAVVFSIYNSKTGNPLNNVTIILKNTTNTIERVVNTGETLWLHYGKYNVTIKKNGYLSQFLTITVNKTSTNIYIYLQPENAQITQNATTPGVNITPPGIFVNVSNNTPFLGARIFGELASLQIGKAARNFFHLTPLFAIFIPLILSLGISVATWYFTHNSLVVLGVLAISGTFWYLLGINLQLSLIQPLAVVIIFFIAWAIWSFYRTKEVGE